MSHPPRRKRYSYFSAGEQADFLGWQSSPVSADVALYQNLNLVKARCRDLARNNDYVRNFLRLLVSNVLGPQGLQFQAQLRNTTGADSDFNRRLGRYWMAAGKLANSPTVCGAMSRTDAEALWLRTLAVDGEAIVLLHPDAKNPFRFAFQLIDPALLDWQHNVDLKNGRVIRMGVELEAATGKPLAYYFLEQPPGDYLWNQANNANKHRRVPANRVLHTYIREQVGQTRGVSWLASPAVRAKMLNAFEEATVVGARLAASKMGFYRTSDDYAGEAPGDAVEDSGRLRQDVEPGTFEQLPRGLSVETFDANYPPARFEEFSKKLLKGIAAGLGVDYVSMANDLEGVNYSSIRAGALEQRSQWRSLQRFMAEHFSEPLFLAWSQILAANPATPVDRRKLERLTAEWAFRFLGRGWNWVDPAKEVKAYQDAIDGRLTSMRRVVAETLGEDLEDLLDEIEQDEAALAARGLARIAQNPAPAAIIEPEPEE